jgi:hypothetical protein
MKNILLIMLFSLCVFNLSAQNDESKIIPYIKTGYGYFNDELMINGNVLSSEIGMKLKNGYLVSLKFNFADAVNDMALLYKTDGVDINFIYSYKWTSLNLGYEFSSKNLHHSFIPMFGVFYSYQLITYPNITDEGAFELLKNSFPMVGIDLSIQYLYNFKNGISVGLNASGLLAYQYGPTSFTLMPIVALKIK